MLRNVSVWLALAVCAVAEPLAVLSPDGNVRLTVDVRDGRPVYSVSLGGSEVIAPSGLGLVPEGAARLGSQIRIVRSASVGWPRRQYLSVAASNGRSKQIGVWRASRF